MKNELIDVTNALIFALKIDGRKDIANTELIAEAERIVKLCNLQNVINWVALEEKLPSTEGNFYLAWYDNCCISKAVWHGGSFTAVEQGWEDETPTHWAELPKPPCL